jgi:Tol biopolymer transport system component
MNTPTLSLRARVGATLLFALLCAGCREAEAPFSADDYGERADTGAVRLSYSPEADHAPAWLPNGDTLIYTADSFEGLPINTHGALLAVPRLGGTVRIVLPEIQLGVAEAHWLSTPAISRDGQKVAFFDLDVVELPRCDLLTCPLGVDTAFTQPEISGGTLRIRSTTSGQSDLATLAVSFRGRAYDSISPPPPGVLGLTILHALPFQRRFSEYRLPAFRPAWSPDGSRVVFSDGLRLLLWTPGSAPTPIAGTNDGVWPAWSPDNQWIAYTRLPRGDSTTIRCTCLVGTKDLFPIDVQDRTLYEDGLAPGTLTLIRPDGTGKRELGEGEAPAWLPDSGGLIVRRAGALWRINVDGSGATQIAGTARANSPAVSSDGRHVAFARQNAGRDWDIWTVPLNR